MRSAKPKNIRTAAAADVSRARALDYRKVDASASVYAGRELLGFVIDGDETCVALTPERALIGTFADRKAATLAILMRPTGGQ